MEFPAVSFLCVSFLFVGLNFGLDLRLALEQDDEEDESVVDSLLIVLDVFTLSNADISCVRARVLARFAFFSVGVTLKQSKRKKKKRSTKKRKRHKTGANSSSTQAPPYLSPLPPP